MNKEWSKLNKIMQTLTSFYDELNEEEFSAIPFINADGYHSKTIGVL